MERENPYVSILMPFFNQASYAPCAVESVIGQTWTDWELLIVNDGSSDVSCFHQYEGEKIRVIHTLHGGLAAALNIGCEAAKGRYIAFLAADDVWEKSKLAVQIDGLEQRKSAGGVFSWCNIIDETGEPCNADFSDDYFLYAQNNREREEWVKQLLVQRDCFCFSGALLRAGAVREAGAFCESMEKLCLQDFWLRLLLQYPVYVMEQPLVGYRKYRSETGHLSEETEESAKRCQSEKLLIQQRIVPFAKKLLLQKETKTELADSLLNAVNAGTLCRNMENYRYEHLAALYELTKENEDSLRSFRTLREYIFKQNVEKTAEKKKLEVAFFADYAATWSGASLYRELEKSGIFIPYIVAVPDYVGSVRTMTADYQNTCRYFEEGGYRLFAAFDTDTMELKTWEQLGIAPDLIFRLTSWHQVSRSDYYLPNCPLNVLNLYIPYGVMIAENEQDTFVYKQYNQLTHILMWEIFEETGYAVDMADKYSDIGKDNAVWLGYPKMDAFSEERKATASDLWKIPDGKSAEEVIKIIYAPHHSIGNDMVSFSTFAENYNIMLELAGKYPNTSWVIRPHQRLGDQSVAKGLFSDIGEYRRYLEKWEALPNGTVSEEGTYEDLFLTSDAMIVDCVSFLAEYLYVHKPLLLLTREEQCFNEFGKKLAGVHYQAEGRDGSQIEAFIEQVLLEGKDTMKDRREAFFDEYLSCGQHDKSAAENITAYLADRLCSRTDRK